MRVSFQLGAERNTVNTHRHPVGKLLNKGHVTILQILDCSLVTFGKNRISAR